MTAIRRTIGIFAAASVLVVVSLPAHAQVEPMGFGGGNGVRVTPDGSTTPDRVQYTSGYSATFTVINTGSSTAEFALSCQGSSNVTCTGLSETDIFLDAFESQPIYAYYSVGAAGTGQLTLTAFGEVGPVEDDGYYNVPVVHPPPSVTIVTPGTSVRSRTPLLRVTFEPSDTTAADEILMDSVRVTWGGVNVTALGRANARLFELEVPDDEELSGPGSNKVLWVKVCSQAPVCTTASRTVTLVNDNAAILSFKTMPLEALGREFAVPFGPGFGISGADVTTGVTTPAYFTRNAARTAGLTYSSRQSYPRALVYVDLDFPSGTPSSLTMKLKDGGAVVDQWTQGSPSCASGCRVALQADYLSSLSGDQVVRKWLVVEVLATISGQVRTSQDSVEVVLVSRRTTPYGSGWWPSGVGRLVVAGSDAVLVASDGSATVFRGNDDQFIAPPGSRLTLEKLSSGRWELTGPGPAPTLTYDAQGRQDSVIAAGQRTAISYNGSSYEVYRITDPAGKYFTFSYSGGRLTTITDAGSRQSTVTISSNRLTLFKPANQTRYQRTFAWHTYTGSAVLPQYSENADNDRTTIYYDGALRPDSVKLPTVEDEDGDNINPVAQYRAPMLKGLDAAAPLSSVYAEVIDPLSHWTRTTVNRWGQSPQVWDTLGTVAATTYSEDGRVLTTEGKVGDSTRVYSTYDDDGYLVRSFRIASSGDTVRLDSLVYTDGWLTKQIDTFGNWTTFAYQCGRASDVISSIGDTARTRFSSSCLPDSTYQSGKGGWSHYTYDGTWTNTASVVAPDGTVLSTNTYGSYGRLTETKSKVTVAVTSATTTFQWRRTLPYYNVINQTDSTRIERTDNCSAPCSTPSWPQSDDTLRTRWTRLKYSHVGRDSVTIYKPGATQGTYGAQVVAYDALGRVVQRWPNGGAGGLSTETFKYDAAGNRRYQVTRLGDTLQWQYDSRNRVTTRTVPGVGTFTYSYGGPNDELTSITAAQGYDDPVGQSNVNLAWAYGQAGQLTADTTQGSRWTVYTYDDYLRLVSDSNAVGKWTRKFNATLGTPDTLVTPFSDRVAYGRDGIGRIQGPSIDGPGTDFSRGQVWHSSGTLGELSNSQGYIIGDQMIEESEPPEPPDSLSPVWTEKHGSGATPIAMTDTLTYDGWGRVVSAEYLRDTTSWGTDEFHFDRAGNLAINESSGWSFDLTSNALTDDESCSYEYDAAGNMTERDCGAVTWTYTYDALNRMTHVTNTSGDTIAYTYDAVGQRIAKKVNGTITRFVWRGGHVIYETDSGGSKTLAYVWGMGTDDLVAVHRYTPSGANYYVVQDRLRSVRGIVQRNGTWISAWRYTLYGEVLDSAGTEPFTLRFRWAGAQYDEETGLYYLRSRYYDPSIGRFVQEDLIGLAGGINTYAYVSGDPTQARDPNGFRDNYDKQYVTAAWNSCTVDWWCGNPNDWDGDGVDDLEAGFETWWAAYGMGMSVSEYEYYLWRKEEAKRRGEPLPEDLEAYAAKMCGKKGLDCTKVRIYEGITGGIIPWLWMKLTGAPGWTPPSNAIYMMDIKDAFTFVHELAHIWQYQQGADTYAISGLISVGERLMGKNVYDIPDGAAFSQLGLEAQAQVIAYCVVYGQHCDISPFGGP